MKEVKKFTPDQIGLIQRTMMPGASKDDVQLFVATCERTGLDPFARQIMASSRNTKRGDVYVTVWNYLVTIDGLRKIAVDSGDYEGQEGPFWCGKDGEWKEVWTESGPCFAAKVTVHRKGFRTGLSGIAKYDSYVQKTRDGKPNQVWSTLGDHMTAKCAEALALRRAYPNEMAGLYITDEMAQASNEPTTPTTTREPKTTAPPTEYDWTEEDIEASKMAIMDFCEGLAEKGISHEVIQKKSCEASASIGDRFVSPETWKNRLMGLAERLATKHKKEQA